MSIALKSLYSYLQRWLKAIIAENEILHYPNFTELTQDKNKKMSLIFNIDLEISP